MAELIKEGYRLLLGSPTVAGNLAREATETNGYTFNPERLSVIFSEYQAIHSLVSDLVGPDNMTVIRSAVHLGLNPAPDRDQELFAHATASIPQVNLPFYWSAYYQRWPRDAHSFINDTLYVDPDAWQEEDFVRFPVPPVHSKLGEGGAVLAKNSVVFVGKETSWEADEEIEALEDEGITVGILPIVNPHVHNVGSHVDGVSSLVEDKYGDVVLLVAKSYYDQDERAGAEIDLATRTTNTGLIVVDDAGFPPLAFNLIQFDDLTVGMTSGAETLQKTVSDLIGSDGVHTTAMPIERIPSLSSGSIRCLTNILPATVLEG